MCSVQGVAKIGRDLATDQQQRVVCRILVPWPGIEPVSPAVEAQSLNLCTSREVSLCFFFVFVFVFFNTKAFSDYNHILYNSLF